jgi:hypothetical protein
VGTLEETTMNIPESAEVLRHRAAVDRAADMRVLESRVRRRLRTGRLVLHKSRGKKQANLLGRYWLTDALAVMPILHHVDLPALADRLHVFRGDLTNIR